MTYVIVVRLRACLKKMPSTACTVESLKKLQAKHLPKTALNLRTFNSITEKKTGSKFDGMLASSMLWRIVLYLCFSVPKQCRKTIQFLWRKAFCESVFFFFFGNNSKAFWYIVARFHEDLSFHMSYQSGRWRWLVLIKKKLNSVSMNRSDIFFFFFILTQNVIIIVSISIKKRIKFLKQAVWGLGKVTQVNFWIHKAVVHLKKNSSI